MIKIERVDWTADKPEVVSVGYRYTIIRDSGEVEEVSSIEVSLGDNMADRVRQTVKAEVLKRRREAWIQEAKTVEGEDLEAL